MSNTAQSPASRRIEGLLDGNSFVEIGGQVTARSTDFNLQQSKCPSDGVVTGYGLIDGNLVYMELSFEGDDYNLYSVPVLLNGEEYNLQVAYDFNTEKWDILGARQGIDDNGMADKELRILQEGDELTTIWYMASASGEDEFEPYAAETITVTADTAFAEAELPDGSYSMVYEMWDAMGNYAYSDMVTFTSANGEITTTVYED